MFRGALSRLLSAAFILLMSGGGGELPALDGLLFHGREAAPASVPAHFESSSGCHADQCAIRSTAHQSRLLPVVTGPVDEWLTPSDPARAPGNPELPPAQSLTQPFSRAPPGLPI